jgi:type II secretory pathway component GspD/PulD (secretin)
MVIRSEKSKALVLLSAWLLGAQAAWAEDGNASVPVKTLMPLPVSATMAPQAVASSVNNGSNAPTSGLSFTPSSTEAERQAPPMTLIAPADNVAGTEGSGTGEKTSAPPTRTIAPAEEMQFKSEVPAAQPAPQVWSDASSTHSSVNAASNTTSSIDSEADMSNVQPAEVFQPTTSSITPGQTANESGGESTPSIAAKSDGEQVAQGALPESLKRPSIPGSPGEVQIKRPFKLFAREEIIHNLSFRETPVREVIAEIARRGNLNILVDKSVVGKITGDLHDVTLNEAMTNVLSAAGLQTRVLPGNTVMIGTQNAFTLLGLNRTTAKAFHLSYAFPYDVAQILHASVFNRGFLPDFTSIMNKKTANTGSEKVGRTSKETSGSKLRAPGEFGGDKAVDQIETKTHDNTAGEVDDMTTDTKYTSKIDNVRNVKSQSKATPTEGQGFQNSATDPGSQQIRSTQEVAVDYVVEQNGGGTICIPDSRNRQVLVVGTQEDVQLAGEAIRLLDRRPAEVHIQSSLLEITNEGIRQIGAAIGVQGQGASANVLGQHLAPLVQYLPGLGSRGPTTGPTGVTVGGAVTTTTPVNILNRFTDPTGILSLLRAVPPANQIFSAINSNLVDSAVSPPVGSTVNVQSTNLRNTLTDVTTASPVSAFTGLLGNLVPTTLPSAAAVAPRSTSFSSFNFLTLGKKAGGRANIATMPAGLNLGLNLLLQTNKAKLVANPSVVVLDNTEALIVIADEVVHKVTTTVSLGVVTTNVELEKAGIFLDVVPKVSDDGFITMRLRPRVSTPLPQQSFADDTVVVTPLSIREVLSQNVRVKDGQTLVIGGLFSEREEAQLGKVPYLAETPILGTFFRNTLKGRRRTELMLLITPKIVEEEPPALVEGSEQKVM